jgi:hypothetical protein
MPITPPKNMKKYSLFLSICVMAPMLSFAQNNKAYKGPFSGAEKRIHIYSGSNVLIVQGSDDGNVVIETDATNREMPEESQGLRVISAGAMDNTGVGANVTTEGNIMTIKIPKSRYFGNFIVKMPRAVSVMVKESGNSYGKWQISGLEGEVEATTSYSTLTIKDVKGPIVARGGYGKINVIFDKLNPSKPNSISASGAVDISLPPDTKASLKLKSQYGDVFTDFDIVPTKDDKTTKSSVGKTEGKSVEDLLENVNNDNTILSKTFPQSGTPARATSINRSGTRGNENASGYTWASSSDNDCNCTDGTVIGNINGGGVVLSVKSDHGNVYVRKRK